MKHLVKLIPTLAAITVGAASFVLSFVALSEVAAQVGAVPANLSWLVPIVVDGGVLAGSASLWAASYRQTRRDPVAYLTVAGLLAFSVVVNINHAGEGVLAKSIAALPPIVLLACLELVAAAHRREYAQSEAQPAGGQATNTDTSTSTRGSTARTTSTHTPHGPATPPGEPTTPPHTQPTTPTPSTHTPTVTTPTVAAPVVASPQPPDLATPGGTTVSKAEQVRAAYDTKVLDGEDPTDPRLIKELADQVGVSETYVRRLIRPMRETRVKAQAPTG